MQYSIKLFFKWSLKEKKRILKILKNLHNGLCFNVKIFVEMTFKL